MDSYMYVDEVNTKMYEDKKTVVCEKVHPPGIVVHFMTHQRILAITMKRCIFMPIKAKRRSQ